MRVAVDRTKCAGVGTCEAAAPSYFEVQSDGTVKVLDESPAQDTRSALESAVDQCPSKP
jgi:ferredoxin